MKFMNKLFEGIFDTTAVSTSLQVGNFMICVGVALVIGLFLAAVYAYKNTYTQSFLLALTLIPPVVCVVIMMVNGNIGAGIAVAGAFGLVRFRSAQGTAKEITAIFLAMGTGLITGMGYLGYAMLFAGIAGGVMILFTLLGIGTKKHALCEKTLHVTIPENLDYEEVFDEIFDQFTERHELIHVKTSNMGSLFKLTYQIKLKEAGREKAFLDQLRTRNGNLEITLAKSEPAFPSEL